MLFVKNETELKIENPTHAFRETNLVLQLVLELRLTLSWRRPLSYRNQSIVLQSKSMGWFLCDNGLRHERVKSKTAMNWKRKYSLFVFSLFNTHYLSQWVLNKLSEYMWFYKSKNVTSYYLLLVFKIVKSLKCILK